MYYQTEIRPDRIAVLLRENSGLTFAELSEILDADLQKRHPAFMDLINILRAFADAGLIVLDGYDGPQDRLAEIIDREAWPYHSPEEPPHRIRLSNHFSHVQRALGFSLPGVVEHASEITWRFECYARPLFGEPVRPPRVADIFVLMPFAEDMKPLYLDHICPAVNNAGLSVMRADDLFTNNSVIGDVWAGIFNCGAVIADCTGRNPNVFYELGIAHTIGKPTILLTRDKEDVPVDIHYLKYILYEFTPRGTAQLESMLTETISSLKIHPRRDGLCCINQEENRARP
jgi:hypothetical protein